MALFNLNRPCFSEFAEVLSTRTGPCRISAPEKQAGRAFGVVDRRWPGYWASTMALQPACPGGRFDGALPDTLPHAGGIGACGSGARMTPLAVPWGGPERPAGAGCAGLSLCEGFQGWN